MLLAVAAAMAVYAPVAAATDGDLSARGTLCCPSTYEGHPSLPGFGPPADINAGGGDLPGAVFAPADGAVSVHSSGGGYGRSII